jgi:XTP/dITP diphosphohydrolase
MIQLSELVFATHNEGKLKELKDLVSSYDIKIYSATDLALTEPEETGETFEENALDKAIQAMTTTHKPALADDSGLIIPALAGQPGVHSARWAAIDENGKRNYQPAFERIQREAGSQEPIHAYFYSLLALALPSGKTFTFDGRIDGTLTFPARGTGQNGFGYDPIFIPEGEVRTFSEMTMAEKKNYSGRSRAFQKFLAFLREGK